MDDPDVAPGFGLPLASPAFGAPTVTGATGTIPAEPAAPATCADAPLALSCLSAGKHTVYVRGLDSSGNWGVVGSAVLNLPKTGPSTLAGAVDRQVTNGSSPLAVSATGDDSAADGTITDAEMFLDTAAADGTGLAMTLNRSGTVVSEDQDVPATPASGVTCTPAVLALSCMTEGTHHLLVHSKDSLGLWGPVLDIPFTLDRTGPHVDAAAVSPNPSNGLVSSPGNTGYVKVSALVTDREPGGALQSTLTGAEGFFAPASATPKPGSGFQMLAVDAKFDGQSEQVYGLIPLSQVKAKANGTYQVYVRGRDEAGNWGDLFAMPLVVDKTAPDAGDPDRIAQPDERRSPADPVRSGHGGHRVPDRRVLDRDHRPRCGQGDPGLGELRGRCGGGLGPLRLRSRPARSGSTSGSRTWRATGATRSAPR